ncbi:unnamed protein product [Spirodela intermedia]|uniref:Uncharacterized protein n=1 Tax=Spirodela intermedia TaxID=51605 RepID=A0A7I8IZ18_SPIIN|nr:unnamed protein product [Spirodela intermedia]CAA6663118.1 unnamed protein product [Spirodela intermedia]CAA6674725.1 unnamed protein product [Spirodela intermedia]
MAACEGRRDNLWLLHEMGPVWTVRFVVVI